MLKSLKISGLRGFAQPQTLDFAIPNGKPGSGLTILVGANNAGKSTTIEALVALNQPSPPSFTQGRRNKQSGDKVELVLCVDDDQVVKLESLISGTSETSKVPVDFQLSKDLFILPSRRVFSPYFGRSSANRSDYQNQSGFPPLRASSLDHFSTRLFEIQKNRTDFDTVMAKVVEPVPIWTIDQEDRGNWFLKLTRGQAVHSSEGLGEGLISLIYIVDALYDSEAGHCIVIDEPELSLHPALQRKLARLIGEYAADRQILLATHSPFFVDFHALENGAKIARVHLGDEGSVISALRPETAAKLSGLLTDQNNPHVLGLNAQEAFFLEEGIILVEGQEDVIFMDRVEADIGVPLEGTLFGWGVGGADKMGIIASMLHDLGFRKVVGILDGDKVEVANNLTAQFPDYRFLTIPAQDIRTKPARGPVGVLEGLLDQTNKTVRPKYVEQTKACLLAANAYLTA